MARSLSYSREASADIEVVRWWYAQPGAGRTAQRRIRAILAAIGRLRQHPSRYPHGDHPGTRRMAVEGHAVIYEVIPDTGHDATAGDVVVLRVFGPGQDRPSGG